MIELREISTANFEECLRLKLTEGQQNFVASNAYSLAEAYALRNTGQYTPMPFAIYHDNQMVGFIMAIYEPDDDEKIYYLARLMIDQRFQGKGFGKAAMLKMIELMKTFPYGPAESIVLSCSRDNTAAYNLYTSLGFVDTGEFDADGDVYCRFSL